MKRERLDQYTERAIRATEAGHLIPPIVYLPRSLRKQPVTLTVDNLALKIDGPTIEENHVRIAAADPVGFLLAVMHGQPIPEFRVTAQGAVTLYYTTPDFETRLTVAKWLGNKATMRVATEGKSWQRDKMNTAEHDAMVGRAAGALAEENE